VYVGPVSFMQNDWYQKTSIATQHIRTDLSKRDPYSMKKYFFSYITCIGTAVSYILSAFNEKMTAFDEKGQLSTKQNPVSCSWGLIEELMLTLNA